MNPQTQTSTPAVMNKPKPQPFNFGTSGNPAGGSTFDVASKTMAKPQAVSGGTMAQLMGTKATVPGGVNTNVSNTLPSGYKAPASQQQVKGSTQDLLAANQQNAQKAADAFKNAPAGTPVQQPQTPATPTAPGLLGTVAGFAQGDPELVNLKQKMDQLDRDYADKTANIYSTPSDLNYQTGRLAAIQSEYNTSKAALNANYQSLLQARGQNIGAAESALGTATQLTPSPYAQPLVNPATGQVITGGAAGTGGQTGGFPPEVMNQYAQMAAKGQYSAIPSFITSNPVLSAALNTAAKQINPSFSPTTSIAQGSSAADLTSQASSIQAQANGAEQNFNLLLNLAKQGGVNDANQPILNQLQKNVQLGLTSNESVASFNSLIQSVRSQYASILGGGTVTVEALQEAQSLIPDNISLSALQSLGTNLKYDAANRVAGINQQIQTLGGGATGQTTTGGNQTGNITWDNIGD